MRKLTIICDYRKSETSPIIYGIPFDFVPIGVTIVKRQMEINGTLTTIENLYQNSFVKQ